MKHVFIFLLLLGVTPSNVVAKNMLPCWLQEPVSGSSNGQIGVSRSIALGKLSGPELSKKRAVTSLCLSLGKDCTEEALLNAIRTNDLFDKKLHFASFSQHGNTYSYAGFTQPNTAICGKSQCDLAKCDPAWLCTPHSKDKLRLLGVSYRMSDANRQYLAALDNALVQAGYLYGVDVTAAKSLTQGLFGTGETRILLEETELTISNKHVQAISLVNQCWDRSTLFTHFELDLGAQPNGDNNWVSPKKWLTNPKVNGVEGVVGVVERMTASGLLSDQIELAIRRGAVQLAFERNSHVRAEHVQFSRSSGGIMYVSYVTEETQVNLKVKVLQIHFEENQGGAIKVFAWVASVADGP